MSGLRDSVIRLNKLFFILLAGAIIGCWVTAVQLNGMRFKVGKIENTLSDKVDKINADIRDLRTDIDSLRKDLGGEK